MGIKNRTGARLPEFDIARAIAVVAIIAYHTGLVFQVDPAASMPGWFARLLDSFHLYVLFIVSGYFTDDARPLSVPYLRRLLRTLIVPYAAACLAIVTGNVLGTALQGGDVLFAAQRWAGAALWGAGAVHSKALIAGIERIGGLWFLLGLFWAKVFAAMLAPMGRSARIVASTCLFAAAVGSSNFIWLPLSIQTGAGAVLYLHVSRLLRDKREQIGRALPAVIAVSLMCWIDAAERGGSSTIAMAQYPLGVADVAGGIGAAIVILWACRGAACLLPSAMLPLERLGRVTLLLFSLHIIEDDTLAWREICAGFYGIMGAHAWDWALLALARIAVDCLVTFALLKIAPVRRLFFPPHPKKQAAAARAAGTVGAPTA